VEPSATALSARDISVVVPVYRAGEMLRECLAALSQAEPGPGEIIVVADGVGDGTWREITAQFDVRVIELSQRRGPGAARNAGARTAGGAVLLFVDADVVVAPNAIGEVVAAFTGKPELAAVFGSYDSDPGAVNFFSQYTGLLNHFVHQNTCEQSSSFWTALGAVRKTVFALLGGFEANELLEDIEFGYRLHDAGYNVAVRKTLLGKHLKHWTASSLWRSDLFNRAIPWTELMLRRGRTEKDLNLNFAGRASVACVFLLVFATPALAWYAPLTAAAIAVVVVTALVFMNRRLYLLFARNRGLAFLAGAVAWHWLHFLYGGIGFLAGLLRHAARSGTEIARVETP
jgi:glycosyltransferase involved in cell wall biosynthesis